MNIVLIGFMGSGKSVVGKIVAKRLGRVFFDTDDLIEQGAGMTISDIFEKAGEPDFRRLETETIRLVSALDDAVISTGGGVPLKKENMEEIERKGIVVWLTAKPETILERLKDELATRPLFKNKEPLSVIKELLQTREQAYRRCSHVVVTDGLLPDQIASNVIELVHEVKKQ